MTEPTTTAPGEPAPASSWDEAYVDTHVHFWDPGRIRYPWLSGAAGLDRPWLPQDLAAELDTDRTGPPVGMVVVESDCAADEVLQDTRRLLALAADHRAGAVGPPEPAAAGGRITGVVAHLPLERGAACAGRVAALSGAPQVVGVRRLLQDERPGFALGEEFLQGVGTLSGSGLRFDLCIRRHQLGEATELVRRNPGVGFVLDHLGKPEISTRSRGEWATDLARLAALPNVRCKLSGLATEADAGSRTGAALRPFLDHAVQVFGPSRCMFGSDWPLVRLAASYAWWLDLVRTVIDDLPGPERRAVLRGTALTTYSGREEPC